MARLVMIADGPTHPGICLPYVFFLLLCQIRIVERSENVIEFPFKLFKFCAKHVDLHSRVVIREGTAAHSCTAALALVIS